MGVISISGTVYHSGVNADHYLFLEVVAGAVAEAVGIVSK
jgi:hypothetical protein